MFEAESVGTRAGLGGWLSVVSQAALGFVLPAVDVMVSNPCGNCTSTIRSNIRFSPKDLPKKLSPNKAGTYHRLQGMAVTSPNSYKRREASVPPFPLNQVCSVGCATDSGKKAGLFVVFAHRPVLFYTVWSFSLSGKPCCA
ncbi:hypothetical protein SRHO_G00151540 [Serrasalmus rhombeus]